MRDLVVLTADGTMVTVLRAFFSRKRWDLALGCGQFRIRPEADIFHNPLHKDGGVYRNAHELLRPFLATHNHAMVLLDQQFGAERPAHEVRGHISNKLSQNGWADRHEVVVIDPELEVWLWQDNPHLERVLAVSSGTLRQQLETSGNWPPGQAKPNAPKETLQGLIKSPLKPKVAYSRIAKVVSLKGCSDPSFGLFIAALRRWFPQVDA